MKTINPLNMKNETTQHTPGPWKVTSYGDGQYSIKNNNDVSYEEGNIPELEDLANARLIASAPDLLKERDNLRRINGEYFDHLTQVQKERSELSLINDQRCGEIAEKAKINADLLKERDEWKKSSDDACKVILDQCKQIASLKHFNAELLEALKFVLHVEHIENGRPNSVIAVAAKLAIAKAEGKDNENTN